MDAFVFPGNSGGPVVLKPEVVAIDGTASVGKTYLIGVVQSYIPYEDIAVSLQTLKPRVVSSENSGLAAVYPVEHIEETILRDLEMREQRRVLKHGGQPRGGARFESDRLRHLTRPARPGRVEPRAPGVAIGLPQPRKHTLALPPTHQGQHLPQIAANFGSPIGANYNLGAQTG